MIFPNIKIYFLNGLTAPHVFLVFFSSRRRHAVAGRATAPCACALFSTIRMHRTLLPSFTFLHLSVSLSGSPRVGGAWSSRPLLALREGEYEGDREDQRGLRSTRRRRRRRCQRREEEGGGGVLVRVLHAEEEGRGRRPAGHHRPPGGPRAGVLRPHVAVRQLGHRRPHPGRGGEDAERGPRGDHDAPRLHQHARPEDRPRAREDQVRRRPERPGPPRRPADRPGQVRPGPGRLRQRAWLGN